MKTLNIITKVSIALALMFSVQTAAQAQFGNLVNKAKNAAQQKAKEAVGQKAKETAQQKTKEIATEQVEKAAQQLTAQSAQDALGEAPALPWVLDANSPAEQMEKLIASLSETNMDEAKLLGKQVSDRAEYDAKLLAGMDDKSIREDEALRQAATRELELADKFFSSLVKVGSPYGPDNMKKKPEGVWYQQGPLKLNLPGKNATYHVKALRTDTVFCNPDNLDAIVVDDAGIEAAKKAVMANQNIAWLLDGYAMVKDVAYEKEYHRATLAANAIGKAIKSNNAEAAQHANQVRADILKQIPTQAKTSSSSTKSSSKDSTPGRAAKSIQGSNSSVTAYVGGTQVGTARTSGSDIYVYTKGSTGSTGIIHSSTIDFRGTTNRYRFSKVGDGLNFYGANGGPVGSVTHNKTMNRYEVRREGTSSSIAEFPDSMDPRYAALLLYKFFD